MLVEPHTADVQDRDGGAALLQISRTLFPFIRVIWADGGYNSERVTTATNVRVEIVSKIANQVGFVVLPRRWVVEQFFAWINRNRRLAKDVEASIKSAAAFLYAAAAMLMIRRLARLPRISKPTLIKGVAGLALHCALGDRSQCISLMTSAAALALAGSASSAQAQSAAPITVTPRVLVPERRDDGLRVEIPEAGALTAPKGAEGLSVTLGTVQVEGGFARLPRRPIASPRRWRGTR